MQQSTMAAAYVKDDQGGTFIPASQRPDGSWRKPRRVKDGYVPQEEVPLYESKGKQFTKNKPAYPVGMTPEFVAAHKAKQEQSKTNPIPGLVIQPEVKKKKKKNKSKGGVTTVTEELAKTSISEELEAAKKPEPTNEKPKKSEKPKAPSEKPKPTANAAAPAAPNKQISTVDPLKRLKNLRKKMKEIESLETKIKNKEIKNPDKEMLEKVARKHEVQDEIKQLEANQ